LWPRSSLLAGEAIPPGLNRRAAVFGTPPCADARIAAPLLIALAGFFLGGQCGAFVMELWGMRVRVEMDGLFGIGSSHSVWPGFSAHAVDWDKPFLSPTGYRSFLGVIATPQIGYTPDIFARDAILAYVEHGLRGKLVMIEPRCRERDA
jgi:hypothetical protein